MVSRDISIYIYRLRTFIEYKDFENTEPESLLEEVLEATREPII